ncbi:MAG: galactitol-1-phosphate 5-dehydrogenase [Armatimonadota bacterium]
MSSMEAAVLHAPGDLRIEAAPRPDIAPSQVLVKVAACGVCGSDVPRITRDGTYSFPLIPGHEFAGVVEEVGTEVDRWRPRDRVAVFPLLPCGKCVPCRGREYEMCDQYGYLGSRQNGGFAEYVAAPAWNLAKVPDNVPLLHAALTEPTSVGLHALRRCFRRADTVAIFGAGPIGTIVAQWARHLGADRVFLADIQPEKLSLAAQVSEEDLVNASESPAEDQIMEATDGRGVDLAVEAAGVAAALADCLEVARKGGRVLIIGNPAGDVTLEQGVFWKVLRKQLTIHGTWNSSFGHEGDDWQTSLAAMAGGALCLDPLITHRFPLSGLPDAIAMMAAGSELHSKVMIVMDESLAGGIDR